MPTSLDPGIARLTAALCAASLVLCHGALGSLHLVPDPIPQPTPADEHAAAHHASQAPGNAASEEHPASHHAEYFAVLLGTFLGGLALCLLLQNGVRRRTVFSAGRILCPPPATVFNRPRGPTLHVLQVLQL